MAERRKATNGSLCWYCKKVGISCEKPVEGWDADYRPLYSDEAGNKIPSWFVRECPNYVEDRPESHNYINQKHYKIFGESLTARQASSRYGIKISTFRTRMERGMTPEQAALGTWNIPKERMQR